MRAADPDTLWSRIGLIPQKPYLFSGTVASTLRYGNPDATDEELWEALRIAQADDWVNAGQTGNVSPGQPIAVNLTTANTTCSCPRTSRRS